MELAVFNFQLDFLKAASHVKVRLEGQVEKLNSLVKLVMANSIRVPAQFVKEVSCELRRLDVSISVERIRQYSSRTNVPAILNKIEELMKPDIPFDQNIEEQVLPLIKEAEKLTSSLGITTQERIQILSAMRFSKRGHWYACPNGHIYCITECGGATVESTCPECKARIGGGSHRLRSDNRVATEMDGAVRSAWPGGT